jgi:predicted DNA-binding transcriptional regulator YafY
MYSIACELLHRRPWIIRRQLQHRMLAAECFQPVRLLPLYKAIQQSRQISFFYMSATGSVSNRTVEPARLYWEHGMWYLEGYCLLRHANRHFRISRITQLTIAEQSFQPREGQLKSEPKFRQESKPESKPVQGTSVHLKFELTSQPRVLEQFKGECTFFGSHIEVNTVFYSLDYALSVILSFGSKVVILSPEGLKRKLLEQTIEIQKRYR